MVGALYNPSTWLDPRGQSDPGAFGQTSREKPQWMQDIIAAGFNPKVNNYEASIRRALLAAMLGPMFQNLQWQGDNQGAGLSAMKGAINILDPRNNQVNIDRFSKTAANNAQRTAKAALSAVRARGGSPDQENAARLYAQNQATSSVNRYASDLESPERLAHSAAAIAQMMGGNTQNMPYFFNSGNNYQQAQKSGGLLGSLSPILGMATQAYFGGTGPFK